MTQHCEIFSVTIYWKCINLENKDISNLHMNNDFMVISFTLNVIFLTHLLDDHAY